MFCIVVLSLAFAAPAQQLDNPALKPYVDLIDESNPDAYSAGVLTTLRSQIEDERDEKLANAKKFEKQWKQELNDARRELEILNNASSVDSRKASERRTRLHIDIAALERGIREKTEEQEHRIPATYEPQLAKLWLLEHWPERRAQIRQRIDAGRARERRHGDIEDIGYRKIVKHPENGADAGELAARQMRAEGLLPPELQDAEVQRYVRSLANKIALNSDLKVPLHLTVLDSTVPKTIVLPGGFIFITSGILNAAHTESELAGLLAREIARIAAQHSSRAAKRSMASRVVMPAVQIVTGILSAGVSPGLYYGIGYGVQGVSGVMDHVLNDSSAEFQKEADQLGVQYAWKAGYDPRGFVVFLESQTSETRSALDGTKTPLQQRLLNLFSEIEYLPPLEHPIVDSPEFQRYRMR